MSQCVSLGQIPCHTSTSSATIRGAVKLHVGLDHEGLLPALVALTDSKTHDITAARATSLPRGSIVVMDRGYNDYAWYNQLNNNDIMEASTEAARSRSCTPFYIPRMIEVGAQKGKRILLSAVPRVFYSNCNTVWTPKRENHFFNLKNVIAVYTVTNSQYCLEPLVFLKCSLNCVSGD